MKALLKSLHLFEVQIARSKLASQHIPSYIKNEFVNHIAVMPVGENYILYVNEADYDDAVSVLGATLNANENTD